MDSHNYVTIMELGQKNYEKELKRMHTNMDYDMVKNEIVKIVTPLVDFHKCENFLSFYFNFQF